MNRRTVAIPTLAVLAATAVPALAATKTVKVGDNWFVRKSGVPTVTVNKGDTVRFAFVGEKPHNVTVKSGPAKFESPIKKTGTYKRKMTRTGTYRIFCELHGQKDQSMVLKVR